jgi:dTMP kinase
VEPNGNLGAKYIVIDGIDGGGKGSLFERLKDVYFQIPSYSSREDHRKEGVIGKHFMYTREPGGTELGEKLRALILSEKMFAFSELCLFMAQRKELRGQVEKALFSGLHVISDRSESASFAYQIRGRNLEHIEDLFWEMNKHLKPFPTLYIFLDLDPKVASERVGHREAGGQEADKFEKENIAFFEKVRRGLIEFATKVNVPCVYVNAEQSKEAVAQEVMTIIDNHIGRGRSTASENVVSMVAKRG